jgi:hypothetical protein
MAHSSNRDGAPWVRSGPWADEAAAAAGTAGGAQKTAATGAAAADALEAAEGAATTPETGRRGPAAAPTAAPKANPRATPRRAWARTTQASPRRSAAPTSPAHPGTGDAWLRTAPPSRERRARPPLWPVRGAWGRLPSSTRGGGRARPRRRRSCHRAALALAAWTPASLPLEPGRRQPRPPLREHPPTSSNPSPRGGPAGPRAEAATSTSTDAPGKHGGNARRLPRRSGRALPLLGQTDSSNALTC